MQGVEIDFDNECFILRSKYNPAIVMLCKGAPDRAWDKKQKTWKFQLGKPTVDYLKANFPDTVFTNTAKAVLQNYSHRTADIPFPAWYKFPDGVTPRPYQPPRLTKAWMKEAYAYFWEMRTGKTFMAVTLASAYYQCGEINKLLVICPSGIKDVWPKEFDKHSDTPHESFVLNAGQNIRFQHQDRLQVLVTGIEAYSQGNAFTKVMEWVNSDVHTTDTVMMVLDESTHAKNPKAIRSQRLEKIARKCDKRLIMTGTPITQGMEDLYQQFRILDPKILGFSSFFTFRNRFCVLKQIIGANGRAIDKIDGYINTNELLGMVEAYSDLLECADVWDDLPERTYMPRWLPPSKAQKDAFSDLKMAMRTEYQGEELSVENMLDRMTRYQQIAGGTFPYPKGRDGKGKMIYETTEIPTPKDNELLSIIEDEIPHDKKVIIWCRFQPEIQRIVRKLQEKYGDVVSQFHGRNVETRDAEKWEFQDGKNRFFVANPATGGEGLELSAADYVIYFSNSFSYKERRQSEARAQHMDKKHSVVYIDLFVNLPIDVAIDKALAMKAGLAEIVSNELKGGVKVLEDLI